jgi:hypothetical protein
MVLAGHGVTTSMPVGMTEDLLSAAIDAGQLRAQPVRTLATIMIGPLDEAAMIVANAEEPEREEAEVRTVVRNPVNGLLDSP